MEAEPPAFVDRLQAGNALVRELIEYRDRKDVIVLAVAKQGIEVALSLAQGLNVPLDLVLSRLLLITGQREVSFGAVTCGVITLNEELVAKWKITNELVQRLARDGNVQARDEMVGLRGTRPLPDLAKKTVIIADDSTSVGLPLISAILWAKRANANQIVIALPVGPLFEIQRLGPFVDDIVCLFTPETTSLNAATYYRRRFDLSDAKIGSILAARTG